MMTSFISIFFSAISVFLMSHVTFYTNLGPWMAPVLVIMIIIFCMICKNMQRFHQSILIMLAAGSLGGVIGLSIGYWCPILYSVDSFVSDPSGLTLFGFCLVIFLIILIAGGYALVLSRGLRNSFVSGDHRFIMSQFIYDILFVDMYKKSHVTIMYSFFTMIGVNIFVHSSLLIGTALYIKWIEMIPVYATAGFVAGKFIIIPMLVAISMRLMLRYLLLYNVSVHSEQSILLTVCLGILIVALIYYLYKDIHELFKKNYNKKLHSLLMHCKSMVNGYKKSFLLVLIVGYFFFGLHWGIYVSLMAMIAWIARYVVRVFAIMGIVEFSRYVYFVLIPLVYFFHIHSSSIGLLAFFVTLVFAIMIDLLFVYRIADLMGTTYRSIIQYQKEALVVAAITATFVFTKYVSHEHALPSLMSDIRLQEFNDLLFLNHIDYRYLLYGVIIGVISLLFTEHLALVIGTMLIEPYMGFVLVCAALFSYYIGNAQRWYPQLFGMYAGQIIYLIYLSLF